MPYQTTLINSLTSEEKGRILAQKAKLLTCIYSVHYKKNEKPEKMKKKKISKKNCMNLPFPQHLRIVHTKIHC